MRKSERDKILENIDTTLKVGRNIGKTFKYFFKNALYVIVTNIFFAFIIANYIKIPYMMFLSSAFKSQTTIWLAYVASLISVLYPIKVILYGTTIYTVRSGTFNSIGELLSSVLKRFLPVVGTFVLFLFVVSLLAVALVVPGLIFFFYYNFAVFFCAVGDVNNKENTKIMMLNGPKALSRSYALTKGNMLRVFVAFIIVLISAFLMEKLLTSIFISLGIIPGAFIRELTVLIAFDLVVIHQALIFFKLQGIENDVLEEGLRKGIEDEARMTSQAMIRQSVINSSR